jgi:CMP-N-acetylneuraminic acid synthetase
MTNAPYILGLIPARGGSRGIPGKNLKLLAGRPLVCYACAAARESRRISRSILSTDCPQIAEAGRVAGVEVPFLRPAALAGDMSATIDVVLHALHYLAAHEGACPEIVVLLQPTAPLRRGHHVDEAVDLLLASGSDAVVSVTRVPAHFHPSWQFVLRDGVLEPLLGTPWAQIIPRRQDLPPTYTRNGAIYAVCTSALESTRSLYGNHCLGYVMPPDVSINIDTQDDWQHAETALGAYSGTLSPVFGREGGDTRYTKASRHPSPPSSGERAR